MRIYFFINSSASSRFQAAAVKVFGILKKAGIPVLSNHHDFETLEIPPQELARLEEKGEILLDKVDGVIIEGTEPTPDIGYAVAMALAHGKNILYLSVKGRSVEENLKTLADNKEISKRLKIQYYTEHNLDKVVTSFLDSLGRYGEDVPSIKFTLRITPAIERYLTWKAGRVKMSKADFLRKIIAEQVIPQDPKYQEQLQK